MQLPALIVGDLHIDERNLHLFKILKKQLKEFEESIPTLVLIGDIFNSPDSVRWTCLLEFMDFLEDTKFEVFMLTGNHDRPMYGQMLSNLQVFNRHGHVIRSVVVDGETVWIPHTSEDVCLQFIDGAEGRVCFSHQMIRGLMLNEKVATAQGLDKKVFSKYEFTFNGHIHQPQVEDNFFNIGSPWQHTFSEAGQLKYLWLFDGSKVVPIPSAVPQRYLIGTFEFLQTEDVKDKTVRVLISPEDDTQAIAKYLEEHGASRWIFKTVQPQDHLQTEIQTQGATLDELVVDFGFRKDLSLDEILMGLHFLEDNS